MQPATLLLHLPSTQIRRDLLLLGVLALLIGMVAAAGITQPGYTDAYYYYNAAQRLVTGKGLTDLTVWTYLGAPGTLPAPSHLYWMPLASLVEAAGMVIFGVGFAPARVLMVVCYAILVLFGYSIGWHLSHSRRIAWLAGLLTLFSGFLFPYWFNSDTFPIYGVVGAGSLIAMGMGRERGNVRWWALGGALAGLAHLTRADGILLIFVLLAVVFWPGVEPSQLERRSSPVRLIAGVVAYFAIMTPWLIRNLGEIGTMLPVGGFQTIWMRSYDEIANYPPGISLNAFFDWGLGNIVRSRWDALVGPIGGGLWTFIAIEGLVVLTPLMLLALWRRRNQPFLSGFILYALALHAAMTLVFAFPGPRGGLLHSISALVPIWAALGALGLDEALEWAARKRRWSLRQARLFFSTALLVLAVALSVLIYSSQTRGWNSAGQRYRELASLLPRWTVAMVNDPPAFYYFSGLPAVVVPNAPLAALPYIIREYGVTHIILDANRTAPLDDLYRKIAVPPFLTLVYDQSGMVIYEVNR